MATLHALHVCSVNDVEEKYYADGEDAYDMRKPFKDVKSKPAILPKGFRQSQSEDAKRQFSQPNANQAPSPASASPDSSATEPAAETTADKSDKKASVEDMTPSANASSGADVKAAQPKTKTAKNKKR